MKKTPCSSPQPVENQPLKKSFAGAVAAGGLIFLSLLTAPATAQVKAQPLVPPKAAAATPFEQSVYLYNTAYDTDLSAAGVEQYKITGAWGKYRSWLGVTSLGAEADPGWDNGNWYACCQHTNWNSPWGTMQQRYGSQLPTVLLGMGQMPVGYLPNDGNPLDFEDAQWAAEANNDPTLMAYFANYAQEVDNGVGGYNPNAPFQKVIIRLGYEFDGFWNPFGNLNQMSNMPANYIKAWQNIITTMRANDPKGLIKFCWNPTDGNVGQIWPQNFYPGDGFVDYIGIDEYDSSYNNDYAVSTVQPTPAQQQAAWTHTELPRINAFADFARAHSKPMVIGEWGLWQLNDGNHPSGGDNPTYIQNMYNWMSDPKNNVAVECYFEAPSDGDSSLSGIFHPTAYPNAANMFLKLFGNGGVPSAPPVPTVLTAFGNAGKVSLNWNPSVGIPSATYSVYRGTAAGKENAAPVKTGLTAPSYVNTGLKNGVTYYYTVKAVNSAGASAFSNETSAVAGIPANYLVNGGFETGDTTGWSLWAGNNPQASFIEKPAAGGHSGTFQYTQWSQWNYQLTLYQTVSGLSSGTHTVSAWVKSSGGQSACQMEVTADGVKAVVPIAANAVWTQISTPISVTAGTVTVGFYSNAAGSQWLNVDDVVVK